MNNILIVATTSYAGMGPYVTGIVNTFSDTDNVYFLFHDYEDDFFQKNVKESLLSHSYFYKRKNSSWNKLKDLICEDATFEKMLLNICKSKDIKLVHFINGPVSEKISKKLSALGIAPLGTVHDLHPHEAKKAPHKMLRHKILSRRTLAAINYDENLATNSKSQLDELKALYPQKHLFLYDFPSLISPEVERGHDIPSELKNLEEPYILFFGRIEEYKGIELLYQAFIEDDEINSEYHDWQKFANNLVYTGQLDEFFDYKYGKLNWRTVSFKTRIENTPNYQGNAVVNYTSHDVPYTRVIEHKHFEMFGQQVYDNPKTVVSEEYSTEYKDGMEPYYPVNDANNNVLAEKYRAEAAALSFPTGEGQDGAVIFGGRLAEYKYYDMAPIIEKSMNLFDN